MATRFKMDAVQMPCVSLFSLSAAARSEFNRFGSSILDQVNFRDNYAIVGQKGIALEEAIEAVNEISVRPPPFSLVRTYSGIRISVGESFSMTM